MGLFGKKKTEEAREKTIEENTEENTEKNTLKEELETEVESLQKEFRLKQGNLDEITQKIKTVKEEYDSTVSNLMLVKKELNQKKIGLDSVLREYKEVKEKIKDSEQIKDSKTINQFKKTEEDLSDTKEELGKIAKEYDEITKQIAKEQSNLHIIKQQQLESEKELEEANSRLYNAKEELNKKDQFQDTNILSPKEKEFIQGENTQSSAGVIEAASVVVGSLKSKLNTTQKELETIQLLLEKERENHEKAKQELEEFRKKTNS